VTEVAQHRITDGDPDRLDVAGDLVRVQPGGRRTGRRRTVLDVGAIAPLLITPLSHRVGGDPHQVGERGRAGDSAATAEAARIEGHDVEPGPEPVELGSGVTELGQGRGRPAEIGHQGADPPHRIGGR
jgi:hypothetical protein